MGKNEIKYFNSIIKDYRVEIDSSDGNVWINSKIGFSKEKIRINQISMDLT
jgi:hypothetical protein